MTALQHADAHERIADLSLEPDRLIAFADELESVSREAERVPSGDDLLDHVAGCEACRRDVAGWARAHGMVREVLVDPTGPRLVADLADAPTIAAPAHLRAAVLAQVRRDTDPVEARPRGFRALFGRPSAPRVTMRSALPAIVVIAILAIAGGVVIDGNARLGRAESQAVALEALSVTIDRVLRDPNHRVIELQDLDGISRGSVAWSSRDLVVLTTALAPAPEGRVYRCWIERGGQRSGVGRMVNAGGTSFWVGTLGAWGSTSFGSNSTFGISLEPVSGSEGNPAILEAVLGD